MIGPLRCVSTDAVCHGLRLAVARPRLRERALSAVKQHCAKADIELLDGNVALRRLALLPDARGRKRLARVYGFEFTVTGEQRHIGQHHHVWPAGGPY